MEYLISYGLPGLFVAAFLAATILPFSSEALLLVIISVTGDTFLPVVVASAGNILGSCLNYYIGFKGDRFVLHRMFRMKDNEIAKARARFNKYGIYSMLLAWVPVIGDPLTVVAGIFRVNFLLFTVFVSIGKIARYVFIVLGWSWLQFA